MPENSQDHAARVARWREKVARYRSLSRLFQERDGSGPLAALARGIEEQIQNLDALKTDLHMHQLNRQVVMAELDSVLVRLRTFADGGIAAHPNGHFTVDDVREESRLCLEEAKAAEEIAQQRLLSAHAFEFARLAKQMSRPPERDD